MSMLRDFRFPFLLNPRDTSGLKSPRGCYDPRAHGKELGLSKALGSYEHGPTGSRDPGIRALEPEILYYNNYGSGARLCYGPIEVGSVGPLLRKRFFLLFLLDPYIAFSSPVCALLLSRGLALG